MRRLAVWSGPRNLSTALMRSFSSRTDCVVSDEPFYAAYLSATGFEHPGRQEVLASQPQDWRQVATAISEGPAPLPRPVWYQKHMAQHMRAEMLGPWLERLDHALHVRLTVSRGLKYTSGLDPRINQAGCSFFILAKL